MFLLQQLLPINFKQFLNCILLFFIFLTFSVSISAQNVNDKKTKTENKIAPKDSVSKNSEVIDATIEYNAEDSIVISNNEKKLYLYGKGIITYGKSQLKADYIDFSFETNVAHATGLPDSTGKLVGNPEFKEGNEPFNAEDITYNFRTKKAVIKGVITKQNDGYLHSEITKKQENGEIHIKNAKYTTCDDPHPHFYFAMTKAIVVPNKRIISGPMYLVLEDVPINKYLPLPFGYIPSGMHRSSGFLMPTYGEENLRGFFIRDIGWYFVINDHVDLAVTGEIYSKGTWGFNARSKYAQKYKYSGNLDFQYKNNVTSEKGLPDYAVSNTMSVRWSHTQDSKANPTQNLSASVNFETNQYHKYNSLSYNELLSTQRSSSISFTKRFPNSPFNLSAQANASQNTKTRVVDLSLPSMSVSMSPVYLFKDKNSVGTPKWYEQIGLQYNANLDNKVTSTDSTIFTDKTLKDFITKFTHGTSLSVPFKLGSILTITPSVSYQGMMNTKYINKRFVETQIVEYDEITKEGVKVHKTKVVSDQLMVDTLQALNYAQQLNPSIGFSISPELYITGIFKPKFIRDRLQAVRYHLAMPVGFSFTPGFGFSTDQYYQTVRTYNGTGVNRKYTDQRYSIFDNVGNTPQDVSKKSGSISIGLENDLEIKVRDKEDTVAGFKKIKLLNLRFSSSINPFADSMRLSPSIGVSGSIELTKTFHFNFNSGLNPYDVDANGREYNKFLFENNKFPFRMTNFSTSFSWNLNKNAKYKSIYNNTLYHPIYNPYAGIVYDDFSVPWNLQFSYSFNYSNNFEYASKAFVGSVQQSLTMSGGLSLTKNWKLSSNTSYDVKMNKFSGTSLNISRDLHCWEMSFGWIPFGYIKSYNFRINIKSAAFKSVEYKIDRRE